MLHFLNFCILFLSVGNFITARELPNVYKRCHVGSDWNKCMADAINDALPRLLAGYKEIGLPQMEPFQIKSLVFEQNKNSPVNIRQEFHNIVMPNFISNTKITNYKQDFDKHEIIFEYSKKLLSMKGDYNLSGRILVLPIEGHGKFTTDFVNLRMKQKLKYDEITKDGEVYYKFTSVESVMKLDKMEMYFENLFNGDKALGESTNRFMNENWQDIFNELEPEYSKAFSAISLKIINKFFSQLPINKIYKF